MALADGDDPFGLFVVDATSGILFDDQPELVVTVFHMDLMYTLEVDD